MSDHKPYPQEHPHFIQGQQFERARIIEVLDMIANNKPLSTGWVEMPYEQLVRIIKGENE